MAIVTVGRRTRRGVRVRSCSYATELPLFKGASGTGDIPLQISQFAVIASTLLLEFVKLIAGLLTAIKAARMSPVEALRHQ